MLFILFIHVGVPTILRVDRGTENVLMTSVQMAIRSPHTDSFSGKNSIRMGKSTSNTVNNIYEEYY